MSPCLSRLSIRVIIRSPTGRRNTSLAFTAGNHVRHEWSIRSRQSVVCNCVVDEDGIAPLRTPRPVLCCSVYDVCAFRSPIFQLLDTGSPSARPSCKSGLLRGQAPATPGALCSFGYNSRGLDRASSGSWPAATLRRRPGDAQDTCKYSSPRVVWSPVLIFGPFWGIFEGVPRRGSRCMPCPRPAGWMTAAVSATGGRHRCAGKSHARSDPGSGSGPRRPNRVRCHPCNERLLSAAA